MELFFEIGFMDGDLVSEPTRPDTTDTSYLAFIGYQALNQNF